MQDLSAQMPARQAAQERSMHNTRPHKSWNSTVSADQCTFCGTVNRNSACVPPEENKKFHALWVQCIHREPEMQLPYLLSDLTAIVLCGIYPVGLPRVGRSSHEPVRCT